MEESRCSTDLFRGRKSELARSSLQIEEEDENDQQRKDQPMTKDQIEIDGVTYRRVVAQPGKRAVVVVDRGWIFAGDVTEANGRIYLDRAVLVFRWESVGFAAVVTDPKKNADIRVMPTRVDIPADAEIFRLPVSDDWGF